MGSCENVRCADTGVLLDPPAVREGRLREVAELKRFQVWDYVLSSVPLPPGAKLVRSKWVERVKGSKV